MTFLLYFVFNSHNLYDKNYAIFSVSEKSQILLQCDMCGSNFRCRVVYPHKVMHMLPKRKTVSLIKFVGKVKVNDINHGNYGFHRVI